MKDIAFLGDSLARVKDFPRSARREAGFQLDRLQRGRDPDDWKPLRTLGAGVREIRVRDVTGAFRVIYVAQFTQAIYVLHAFQKKTRATAQKDLDLARARFAILKHGM